MKSNPAIRPLIQSLRQEFAIELANLEGAPNLGVELDSAYARVTAIAGRPLRDSYNFAQTLYDDYGRPYGQGFNTVDGGAVRAEAGHWPSTSGASSSMEARCRTIPLRRHSR